MKNVLSSHFLTPFPTFPQRGRGPTVKKSALWLILGRGQVEQRPPRQSGSFAKIAYQVNFSTLSPLGGNLKGGKSLTINNYLH